MITTTAVPGDPRPTPDRLLRRPAVEAMVGLRRAAIYDLVAKGQFPRPVRIGARAVAWRSTDIAAWISSRPTARTRGAA
jgi:prophage regulatory protein